MRYVVLGASAAGVNGVRELRKQDKNAEILLISQDDAIYSRCILHHYISGIRTKEALCFAEPDFEQKYQVNWKKGVTCVSLDEKRKEIRLSDNTKVSYDKLLIATGSHTFFPPIKGMENAKEVFGFHNFIDAKEIKETAKEAKHVIVMGGGLVGIDAVTGLLHMGKKVSLVEMAPRLLVKQLDKKAASTYEKALKEQGVSLYLETGIKEVLIEESGALKGALLSNGEEISCDMLIVAAGVRANIEFLKGTSVALDSFGLNIDETGQTNVADIYGAGDVTGRSPIWPAAVKQGMIAADNMTGLKTKMEDFFASKSTMNFFGVPTMALGVPEKPNETYQEEIEEDEGIYRKIIYKNGKIYGAILQGDLSYGGVLTQLIARKIDISRVKKPLFKIDYSDFFHTKENFEYYYEEN